MSTNTILFPNLGITLPHVGRAITIGNFEIAYYGICIALAMFVGITVVMWVAKKTGQDPDTYFNFGLLAMVVSLMGARAYYVAFMWDYYSKNPLEILNFRGGGLAIYGGVIAGVLTGVIYCKVKKLNIPRLLDTSVIGLALGQAIGRWGNFFNREAFGDYSGGLLAMALPQDAVRAGEITQTMQANVFAREGVNFIQVHPTFLYESLWNLCLALVLLMVTLHVKKRRKGDVFCLYLMGYGLGRFWIEGLRTDQLLLWGSGVPVSQALSAVLAAGAFAVMVLKKDDHGKRSSKGV